MTIVGIDLGTTNSLIAYWDSDKPVIIPNALGDHMTPSVVGVDDNGDILVGMAARERLVPHPLLTAALFKRHMGADKTFRLGNQKFRAEELSALVLRALKADAEAHLGKPVSEAVISVPAYFNDIQRKATQAAAQLAGLKVERLINEPTAAAIAYGLHQKYDEATILVFDLGGGTFDVSILEYFSGIMEVRATAGDCFLGGEDFVQAIVAAFSRQNHISVDDLAPLTQSLLLQKAVQAMHQLSSADTTSIDLSIDGRSVKWPLSRKAFEELTIPLQQRIRRPVERAMMDAHIKTRELTDCVLVGGATRMPLVRKLVARMFSRFPVMHINPDEAVALGVAVQAGLKVRDKALKEVVFTDVCPFSLGIEVTRMKDKDQFSSGHFAPIMERGVVIPASKEERFCTMCDDQDNVEVAIYQGEGRQVKDNIRLGRLTCPVPAGPAGSEAVDVRFTYTIDGILEVDVKVVSTGDRKNIVIEEAPGALTSEEIQERLASLAELKIHPRDNMKNRALLAHGERLYEARLKDDRQAIADAMVDFEIAIESQDPKRISRSRSILETLLKRLEEEESSI